MKFVSIYVYLNIYNRDIYTSEQAEKFGATKGQTYYI